MNISEYKGVFVYAEQIDNIVGGIALELIGKGKDLAKDLNCEVTAVLLGSNIKDQADRLAAYGADKIILIDNPVLAEYRTEPYTQALAAVIEKFKPEIFLVGATAIGRDLAPRVCARVHTGLTADCTGLDIGDYPLTPIPEKETKHNQLLMTRPAFGGNTIATIACPDHRPQMATVRPGVMKRLPKNEGAKAVIEEFNPSLTPNSNYVEIIDIVKSVADVVEIMDAKILVSGGRGVGGPENFAILDDLAKAIGGTLSCSRAVVDAGWQPKDLQVGQTGKTVRPNLYIAVGISGAIQHLAGMEESDLIIAINKDETAPIFEVADYGIVGDYKQILPGLTARLKAEIAAKET
jgi:electron transfer flavoprotein alpha subunit